MAQITPLNNAEAEALIQKINDENTKCGNKKTEIASLFKKIYDKSNVLNETNETIEFKGKLKFTVDKDKKIFSAQDYFSQGNMSNAVLSGFNILPVYQGVTSPDAMFNEGYVVSGVDVFTDFTGDTQYRPGHPAHDSLVAFGRGLGKGVLDGTNITLFGTDVFGRNDVKYWDSVTAFGKGINNNKFGDLDPNRVVNAVSNGFSLRDIMYGVIAIGNEIWAADIHSSTLIGQQIKRYKYIYNSIVIGCENQDYASVKYPGETGLTDFLDNDVIIGNGLFKDPKKYPQTHNLLIGSTTGYGNGGWNVNYIPLIEGNFKDKYFNINGSSEIDGVVKVISQPLNEILDKTSILVEPTLSRGWSGNVTDGFTVTDATTDLVFPINPVIGKIYSVFVKSNGLSGGSWGFSLGGYSDYQNDENWIHTYVVIASNTDSFTLTVTNGASGNFVIEIFELDNSKKKTPAFIIENKLKEPILEVFTSPVTDLNTNVGLSSGGKLNRGVGNSSFGANALSDCISGNQNSAFGTNSLTGILPNVSSAFGANALRYSNASRNSAFGVDSQKMNKTGTRNNSYGDSSLKSNENTSYNTAISSYSLSVLDGGEGRNTALGDVSFPLLKTGADSLAFGYRAGDNVTTSTGSLFIGNITSGGAAISVNEIVIGDSAIGHGNNTVTIGNTDITDNYFFGKITSSGFAQTGGTANKVLIANGTSSNLSDEIINDAGYLRLNVQEYHIDATGSLTIDNRNRINHIVNSQENAIVNLSTVYPKQEYVFYNNSSSNLQIKIGGVLKATLGLGTIRRIYISDNLDMLSASETSPLGLQIKLDQSGNVYATDSSYNLKTIICENNCSLSFDGDHLDDGFQMSGYVKEGFTLQLAILTGTFLGNNGVTSVVGGKSFTAFKINGTNDIVLKIEN